MDELVLPEEGNETLVWSLDVKRSHGGGGVSCPFPLAAGCIVRWLLPWGVRGFEGEQEASLKSCRRSWWVSGRCCPCLLVTAFSLSLSGPGLRGADPLSAGGHDPDPLDEGAIAAAPARTPHDKAKRLDSFLFFNLSPIRLNIVPFL